LGGFSAKNPDSVEHGKVERDLGGVIVKEKGCLKVKLEILNSLLLSAFFNVQVGG